MNEFDDEALEFIGLRRALRRDRRGKIYSASKVRPHFFEIARLVFVPKYAFTWDDVVAWLKEKHGVKITKIGLTKAFYRIRDVLILDLLVNQTNDVKLKLTKQSELTDVLKTFAKKTELSALSTEDKVLFVTFIDARRVRKNDLDLDKLTSKVWLREVFNG